MRPAADGPCPAAGTGAPSAMADELDPRPAPDICAGEPGSPSRRALVLSGVAALTGAASGCAALTHPAPPMSAAEQAVPPASPAPRGRLEGRVALVTGAARGIGRSIAVACAREGANVVGLDICAPVSQAVPYPAATRDDLSHTQVLVEQQGRRFLPVVADVRDAAAVRKAADDAVGALGRLDVLVANAGIQVPVKLAVMDDRAWQDVIDVNLTGVGNALRAAMPHMVRQQGGRMIAIASVEGRRGTSFAAQYNASKWGVIGLVKSAALELGEHGITVNAVCPTAVDTPLFRNQAVQTAVMPPGAPHAVPERLIVAASEKLHPLRVPWIEPEDVAAVVVFLASPEARYVSGAAFDVTAGLGAQYTA